VTPRANGDLVLFQLLDNGSIDSSYGQEGYLYFNNHESTTSGLMTSDSNYVYLAQSYSDCYSANAVVKEDVCIDSTPNKIRIYRFNHEGVLDSGYANMGISEPYFENNYIGHVESIAIQNDGKLLVGGVQSGLEDLSGYTANYQFLVRLNVDGSIDSSFGTNGVDLFNWGDPYIAIAFAVSDEGKIVFEYIQYDSASIAALGITLLKEDGNVDSSFGINGYISFIATGTRGCFWMDNKIISVVNNWNAPLVKEYLIRHNEDGSIDSSFGTNGVVALDSVSSYIYTTVAMSLPDGKIIAYVGASQTPYVKRFNNDGSIDSTFGNFGVAIVPETDAPHMDLSWDNKILITGHYVPDFLIARLLNDVSTSSSSIDQVSTLKIFPNPTSDQLVINYPFSSNEQAVITIADLSGKILREEKVSYSGDYYIINVNDFPAGIYLLTFKTKLESMSVKVMKQ
jgi:uncharacterized delta-60 repeat protein